MPKIVILGSCRYEPYIILFMPNKVTPPELYNTEEGYRKISKLVYAAIDNADEVWIYAPDGKIGEHTSRDIKYALEQKKIIRLISPVLTKSFLKLSTHEKLGERVTKEEFVKLLCNYEGARLERIYDILQRVGIILVWKKDRD